MKKLFYCIVCAIAIGVLSSCDTFDSKKSNKEDYAATAATTAGGAPTPQKIEEKIAEQDTLRRVLASKVDTLSQKLSQVQGENDELKTRTTKLESTKNIWSYMAFASLIIAIIALILSLVNLSKLKKKVSRAKDDESFSHDSNKNQETVKAFKEEIRQLKRELNNDIVANTNKSLMNLEGRILILENKLPVDTPQTTATNNQKHPSQNPKPESPKVGYAKIDTDMYFTTIYDSNQEGCVFKITFTGPNAGKFHIISLDKIQSRNDWQQKIECHGCSIKEAHDFRVVEDGLCEKADENTWKVTRRLKIKLLK